MAISRPNKSPGPLLTFDLGLCFRIGFEEHSPFDPICFSFFSRKALKKEILSSAPSKAKSEDKERS
jgi:hypothetical protein